MIFLGVDLGTSAVKAVLVDERGAVAASASAPLNVARPRPLWSEQDPADWINAARTAILSLPSGLRSQVCAVGLSGQMHGATLLDAAGQVLRPCLLWNDNRAVSECRALETAEPRHVAISGNRAMPGFTAPKLEWVRRNEPDVFSRVRAVLLPKDYLRLWLSGDYATDMSDASGTLWLDVARRDWSDILLSATGLTRAHMPRLAEGIEVTGALRANVAAELGLPAAPVVAGGGDNAASGVGMGVIAPGSAFVSVGTSGVIFIPEDHFAPAPDRGVHTFCHSLPQTWHRMAVMLSAASAIDTVARLSGYASTTEAVRDLGPSEPSDPIFAPWLSGERTPYNDAAAAGAFIGLTHATQRQALVRCAIEGVAFGLAEGFDALGAPALEDITVVGGGAHIRSLGTILSATIGRPLAYREGGETASALGAARLARIAITGESPRNVCRPPSLSRMEEPDPILRDRLAPRRALWRRLHPSLSQIFDEAAR